MEINKEQIITLLQMLSKTFGNFYEIRFSDSEKILFIENAITDKKVGDELTDNEKYFISNEDFKKLPFVANYKSVLPSFPKLRSSTYFIKDTNGEIIYLISFTSNVEPLLNVKHLFDNFINGKSFNDEEPKTTPIPKLDLSLESLVINTIDEGEKRFNAPIARMTMQEKQSIIREMHSRGVFLVKGAVPLVSGKLGNSEATVYRYIKKLEKTEK